MYMTVANECFNSHTTYAGDWMLQDDVAGRCCRPSNRWMARATPLDPLLRERTELLF